MYLQTQLQGDSYGRFALIMALLFDFARTDLQLAELAEKEDKLVDIKDQS